MSNSNTMRPNKCAGANGHCPFSFDRDMKFVIILALLC